MQIILAGIGGQGVVLATELLAQAAVAEDMPFIGSETHGMAQRGGSVVSHVKIGGTHQSPLVRQGSADLLLAFDKTEGLRNLGFLARNSKFVFNGSMDDPLVAQMQGPLSEQGVELFALDADKISIELKAVRSVNLIMLAFAVSLSALPFSRKAFEDTIRKWSPPAFAESNLKAVAAGFEHWGKAARRG